MSLHGSRRPNINQWLGAAAVLIIAGLYALFLPGLDLAMAGGGRLESGDPYEVVEGLSIIPVEGWRVESRSDALTSLTKDGATLVFVAIGPRRDVHDVLDRAAAGLEGDPNTDWNVGEPVSFTTDAGDSGWAIQAQTPTEAQRDWFVVHGDAMATMVGSAADEVWLALNEEMDAMVRSAVFTGSGQ